MNNLLQLIKNAPITAMTAIETVGMGSVTTAGVHDQFGGVDASATAQVWVPLLAVLAPIAFNTVKWALATPWEKAKGWAEEEGLVTDSDIVRVSAAVREAFDELVGSDWLADQSTGDDHLDAQTVGPPLAGVGMSAGAPDAVAVAALA